MSKKEYDVEQRAEEILRAFAMEMGKNNEAFAKAVLDENQPDPPLYVEMEETAALKTAAEPLPADAVSEELPAEFTPDRPHRSRRVLRRTLILAAVLILMMGLVVCTSEGVRLKLSSLFFGDAPGSTRVLDDSNLVVDLEKVELGYVPEGFEVVYDDTIAGIERVIYYEDDDGNFFDISITKTDQYATNVDNDRSHNEKVLINDREGYFFFDEIHNTYIWQIGDSTIDISSPMDAEEVLEIAKSITINH